MDSNIKKHFELLGLEAKDKVTGYSGVVTSLSFDLYGCIQVVLTPECTEKDNGYQRGSWFDIRRLEIIGSTPVMDMPNYDLGYIAEGRKGAAEKPLL